MNIKWICLTLLAVLAVGWNVFVWTAEEPPDVGAPCITSFGLLVLAVIYIVSEIRRGANEERRGFPVIPNRRDRKE